VVFSSIQDNFTKKLKVKEIENWEIFRGGGEDRWRGVKKSWGPGLQDHWGELGGEEGRGVWVLRYAGGVVQ